jgi:uncharacterized protein
MPANFSLLVKPASADCNLHCTYCFYLDRKALYPEVSRHRMSDEVLEKMISSYMSTPQATYSFGWQGGEPTLMGVEFFRKVVRLQERYGRRGAVVANGLQTNATMITDELAQHLARYRFLVGASLDGPAGIHDRFRTTVGGRGSHKDVLAGIERLRRYGVEHNILVLVSASNVEEPRKVYRYLLDMGVHYHQYIPCVEFDETGQLAPYSITGEQWGRFLCGIFDEWSRSDVRKVSVRHFDSVMTMIVDGYPNVCHMGRNCCQYFVVEYNGDVYPCDFFVTRDLRLGNVMSDDWESLRNSPLYREFGARKTAWNPGCNECPHLSYCSGDCLKHRVYGNGDPSNMSVLCDGWKIFFDRSIPTFEHLAGEIKQERVRAAAVAGARVPVATAAGRAPGRNELCPCGSGRKYKYCCGR